MNFWYVFQNIFLKYILKSISWSVLCLWYTLKCISEIYFKMLFWNTFLKCILKCMKCTSVYIWCVCFFSRIITQKPKFKKSHFCVIFVIKCIIFLCYSIFLAWVDFFWKNCYINCSVKIFLLCVKKWKFCVIKNHPLGQSGRTVQSG